MEIQESSALDFIKQIRAQRITQKSSQFPGFYILFREYLLKNGPAIRRAPTISAGLSVRLIEILHLQG
jgi:hypothetical protein